MAFQLCESGGGGSYETPQKHGAEAHFIQLSLLSYNVCWLCPGDLAYRSLLHKIKWNSFPKCLHNIPIFSQFKLNFEDRSPGFYLYIDDGGRCRMGRGGRLQKKNFHRSKNCPLITANT